MKDYSVIDHVLILLLLGLVALAILDLIGCAHPKPVRNYQPGAKVKTYIDLKHCHDGEHGDYWCDKAHFVPLELKAN